MSLVSCVIPNYNYAQYLKQAIDSALAQTHREIEVIVIDDGSEDASLQVLATYGSKIRWYSQRNQGVSVARNRGIEESRGDFIGFLDADDVWHRSKIERQLPWFQNPEVGLVHCWVRDIDATGKPLRTIEQGSRGRLLRDFALIDPAVAGGGSAAVVRRKCFEKVGYFDPMLSTSADWDMWRRIATHYLVEFTAEPLLDYRVHGSAMHHNVSLFERDMTHALDTMFKDAAAAEIRPLLRASYSKLYSMISADHFASRSYRDAARFALRSLALSPQPLTRLVQRKVRKKLRFKLG